jgi:GNAT superfamily N-acetyltransferase
MEQAIAKSPMVLSAPALRARRDEFVALLRDAVEGNASVGFVQPLAESSLQAFWDDVAAGVEEGERSVLAAVHEGRIVGSVQLAPCTKDNGRHRAEVQKLLVHSGARRRGIARALMDAVEARARLQGVRLLLLDTREASAAESLYRRSGWTAFGTVPDYACDPDRTLAGCVFFYKRLD